MDLGHPGHLVARCPRGRRHVGGELRGVISAVQLQEAGSPEPEPPGFTVGNLATLQLASSVLARMIEHQLMSLALGREEFR